MRSSNLEGVVRGCNASYSAGQYFLSEKETGAETDYLQSGTITRSNATGFGARKAVFTLILASGVLTNRPTDGDIVAGIVGADVLPNVNLLALLIERDGSAYGF